MVFQDIQEVKEHLDGLDTQVLMVVDQMDILAIQDTQV